MTNSSAAIVDEAIAWQLKLATMRDDEWPAFIAWLEASPAHAGAFDRVAATDRLLAGVAMPAPVPLPVAANDDRFAANDDTVVPFAPRRAARRWGWTGAGMAVAASLALLVIPMLHGPAAKPYWLETKSGESRQVVLSDGTRIEINGGSRLGLDHADPRVATLERGEAVFHVRHDAGRPFTVRSGGLAVQDVGTVFDVARRGLRLDVAVAEGAVLFEPDGERVPLAPGQSLSVREDLHQVTLGRIEPALVGGWRGGQLAFTDASLADVAAAIERRYGTKLVLDDGLSQRGFTGMVAMSGKAERDIPHLAALIGAEWRRRGDQWILAPGGNPAR